MAYVRKLTALRFHNAQTFSLQDEKQVRNLVVWLEDQKIRFYDTKDREPLRDVESQYWIGALKKYLSDLKCPVDNLSEKDVIVNWLISYAVHLEFEENASKYNDESTNLPISKVDTNSWLHSIDANDGDLIKGIEMLRQALRIPNHPNHITVLQAVSKLIQERLASKHMKTNTPKQKTTYLDLDEISLGFNIDDSAVREAAKILRLLQIHQLRDLQTKINQSIVTVQMLSANPKTDQSLGKVGR